MKYILIMIMTFSQSLIFGQENYIEYQSYEFEDYSPLWKYVIIDSTKTGEIKISKNQLGGNDTTYYDGFSHLIGIPYTPNLVIKGDTLFVIRNQGINYFPGGYLVSLDLNSGRKLWDNRYGYAVDDPIKEYCSYGYINKSDDLELLNFREKKGILPPPFWVFSTLCLKNFNTITGTLTREYISDVFDPSVCQIIAPISHNIKMNSFILPGEDSTLLYFNMRSTSLYVIVEHKIMTNIGIEKFDTTLYFDNYFSLSKSMETKQLQNGNYFFYYHNTVGNPIFQKDSFQLNFAISDSKFNLLQKRDLTEKVKPALDYFLSYSDEKHFIISGIDYYEENGINYKEINYYLFDYEGNLIEKIQIQNDENLIFSKGEGTVIILSGSNKMLIARNERNTFGSTSLNFYISDGSGEVNLLKNLNIIQTNHYVTPQRITELENGDFIIECEDYNKDLYGINMNPTAQVLMYIFAEDIGLKTIVDDNSMFSNLTLSPNPTADYFTISCEETANKNVEVLDHLGRLVLKQNIEECEDNQVEISALNSGLYLVRLIDDERRIVGAGKLVKD